jgi:hypothetical protein
VRNVTKFELSPEDRIRELINPTPEQRATCERCIKLALTRVHNSHRIRHIHVTGAVLQKRTLEVIRGMRIIEAAMAAGAFSPIPGLDHEQIEEYRKAYEEQVAEISALIPKRRGVAPERTAEYRRQSPKPINY